MAVPIATRTLFERKLRFVLSSGGVALAIMLILVLDGLSAGISRQVAAYLENSGANLIVSQKGIRNFLGARSAVPSSSAGVVEDVPGVRKVTPVIVQYVVLQLGMRKEFSLLIGFDPKKGGGPWEMVEGTKSIGDDEVIFDNVVARRHDMKLGEREKILGRRFKIAGLSGGTSSWMTGTFFLTFDSASSLIGTGGNPSFLLVELDKGVSGVEAARRIEDKTGLTVTTMQAMSANDIRLFSSVFQGPVNLMVGIAFLIGVLLVGFSIYSATVERAKQYGALKAIGIRNSRLYAVVFGQTLIASAVGFVAGVGLAYAVKALLAEVAPQFFLVFTTGVAVQLLVVALAMSLAASYVPVRLIASLDPAIAFKKGV